MLHGWICYIAKIQFSTAFKKQRLIKWAIGEHHPQCLNLYQQGLSFNSLRTSMDIIATMFSLRTSMDIIVTVLPSL